MEKSIEVIAAKILSVVEKKRLSMRLVMEHYFRKNQDVEIIRGVVRAYLLGLLRKYRILDAFAENLLDIQVSTLGSFQRSLLRSILYESKFRDVKRRRLESLLKFARKNGLKITWQDVVLVKNTPIREVLRRYQGVERVAVEYSLPTWVVEYSFKLLGKRESFKLFKAFNKRQPTWIRVITNRTTREKLLKVLERRGFEAFPDKDFDDLIGIRRGEGLARIPEHKSGLFVIQEKASVLVGYVSGFREIFVDFTSSPGLKLSHISERTGYGIGFEIKHRRIPSMKNILERIGSRDIIDIVNTDSRVPPLRRGSSNILLDPDCSSLGRLGVSPEIRLWITPDYVSRHREEQRILLKSASGVLEKGRCLIYSTCTFTIEENEENINWAVEELGLEVVEVEPFIGVEGIGVPFAQRLYPHIHHTIGFFVAKLCKI
ncbi:MAG: hypothetical protein DRJ35_00760 [Thermoprotei archaeon]|nr:MAG: hypothetical protein DRJ35_00760 [Thermoprotei archaeon]